MNLKSSFMQSDPECSFTSSKRSAIGVSSCAGVVDMFQSVMLSWNVRIVTATNRQLSALERRLADKSGPRGLGCASVDIGAGMDAG